MNKKGFTLIELLAVLVILGMLIVMAVPNIIDIFDEKKEELYNNTITELKRITSQYLVSNPSLYIDIDSNGYVDVPVEALCVEKFLSCPVNDPRDNSEISGVVRITNRSGDYVYNFYRDGETIPDDEPLPPTEEDDTGGGATR